MGLELKTCRCDKDTLLELFSVEKRIGDVLTSSRCHDHP